MATWCSCSAAWAVDGGELVDIVSDANPGVPWCWAVLTLQKAAKGPTETLTARRATLCPAPPNPVARRVLRISAAERSMGDD